MERAFKGVWIPKDIWLSKDLTLQEKVFLVEIGSLDNERGCFASNAYFADFFQLSKNRCSEVIKSLEKKNLISIHYVREKGQKNIKERVIRVVDKSNRGIREFDKPSRETEEGYSEKCEENNTGFNNTNNSKTDSDESSILFDQWWNLYDNKKGKVKAKQKFIQLLKKYPYEQIEQGTKRYLAQLKREGTDKKYMKYPTTFLNGEHFNDEYDSPAKSEQAASLSNPSHHLYIHDMTAGEEL